MNVLNKGSLGRRILKRLLSLIIVVWGVVTLSFCLQVFTGTDPAEMIVRKNSLFATEEQIQAVREQLGLDAPFHERYIDYIKGVATGDLGTAITNRQPVIENIKDALPVTCTMIIMAMAWVILFTVILSAISVIRKNGIFDNVTRIVCIIGICVPSFWLALILLTAFAVNIPIFSVIADGSIKSLILPSIAMAVPIICISTRVLRASVLNELKSDSKLAARFWDSDSGKVTLGGVDVKTVEPETLFKNFAIVFQDVLLFDETVMENIRLGRNGATDEEVMAAAKAAQCEEFIQRLPQGYQTNIGENGSALSGGERQRISIARALLKNAPVVLLDEATASMDAESETLVQEALSALLKDKTVMVIAHRMRTVANADKIVVLDDGKISEMGTPKELMKKNGLYSHLVNLQRGK